MADGLLDIGGGFKVIDPSAVATPTSPLGAAQGTLGLVNLLSQIQQAPLASKKLEIETALKANELLNLNTANLLQKAQLTKALGDERRAQAQFTVNVLKGVNELFKVDPSLGAAALQQVDPDATSTVNQDGTVSIEFPSQVVKEIDGQSQVVPTREKLHITIDPSKVTPEKKRDLEGQWYDRFNKNPSVQNFKVQGTFYRNMRESAELATGAGDLAIVFSFMKLLDPTSSVREGEQATVKNTPNVPDTIRNMYNKAFSTNAPVFGEKGSAARQNILNAGAVLYNNARSDVLAVGRDLADLASRDGLSVRNILGPVGDITENEFLKTDDQVLEDLRKAAAGGNAKP